MEKIKMSVCPQSIQLDVNSFSSDEYSMPFIKRSVSDNVVSVTYWVPKISGVPGDDYQVGRSYADLVIKYFKNTDDLGAGVLLSEIVREMNYDGVYDAVNTGFVERIAEGLMGC